ncbi:MAG: hypothetical protein K8Q91_01605 [Candidatus Vogelbacteria bacterium]|jgi:hypothetical protein|nr:hypothetical protein [Candidatus Vogelbacteria bacterium]
MDDINNKRSLREVLPKHGQESASSHLEIKPMFTIPEPNPITNKTPRRTGVPVKSMIISLALVLVVIFGIIVSTTFAKAVINITPRQADVVLDGSTVFQTKSLAAEDSDLVFGTVNKDFVETKLVQATGEKDISEKAQGTIIIYNAFDDKPAKLVATTRFETANGKIYRIKDAVTIPGMKGTTPGSVEAVVYADKAGSEYNIALSDFTVPGLKSDAARFNKVYARSKTPMTGGFVGKTKIISEADRKTAEAELKDALTKKSGSIALDIPSDQILLPDGNLTSFSPLKVESATSSNQALLSLKMTNTGILLKRADLAKFLAQKYVPEYKGDPVDIDAINDLTFKLENKTQLNPTSLNTISFTITGKARLVWTFDENNFKESVKGLSKSTYSEKLAGFPAIQKSSISFRPPWIFSIPSDINKIEIKKELAK